MKVDFHDVEATLLAPLWARAKFSGDYPSIFNDDKAIALVDQLDYDFSAKDAALRMEGVLAIVARAKQFDDRIRAYLDERPGASIINVGAGLDTTFYRAYNGLLRWYELDLPNVIEVRRKLLPEPEGTTYIAGSLLDARWCTNIKDTNSRVFLFAVGVLDWLEESQVKQFFVLLADNLPGAEIVVNTQSRLGRAIANFGLRRTGVKDLATKWALKDARKMTKWDDRITVVDDFSFFKDIPYDPARGEETMLKIRAIDEQKRMRIVHVRFNS